MKKYFYLFCLLYVLSSCGTRPEPLLEGGGWLGVSYEREDRADVLKKIPQQAGIHLTYIVPDSPADRAGLQANSVLTHFGERQLKGNRIEADFSETVRKYSPEDHVLLKGFEVRETQILNGKPIEEAQFYQDLDSLLKQFGNLNIKMRRQLRSFQKWVILGSKPSVEEKEKADLPYQENYYGEGGEVASLLSEMEDLFPVTLDKTNLWDRWSKDETHEYLGQLSQVKYLHMRPLQMEWACRQWADQLMAPDFLKTSFEMMDWESPESWQPPQLVAQPQNLLEQIHEFLDDLEARRTEALAGLEPQLSQHRRNLVELCQHLNTHIYLSNMKLKERQREIRDTLVSFDQVSAQPLAENLVRTRLFFSPKRVQTMLEVLKPYWGRQIELGSWQLRLGTEKADLIRGRPHVVLDPGGDDIYQIVEGESPILAGVDLGGDDQVVSRGFFGPAGAFANSSFWLDVAGNDTYMADRASLGFACFGAALLEDHSGQDRYQIQSLGLGGGLFGLGILRDDSGNDTYRAQLASQGFAWIRSVGLLLDLQGDDSYQAGFKHPSSYGTSYVYRGLSQGSGLGLRGIACGGIGALVDARGSDLYLAGNFSQASGYFFSLGFLIDRNQGDDRYWGSRYCQAASAHSAIAFLEDEGGNDHYQGWQGSLQGGGWDLSVAIFIDRQGDDHHQAGKYFSNGASAHNSLGVFLDLGGSDQYDYESGYGLAGPNDYHQGDSLSLFLDQGGQDRYRRKNFYNNLLLWNLGQGFFVDRDQEDQKIPIRFFD